MTEVRPTAGGSGLFAAKPYEPGDVILDEAPLFAFRPLSLEQERDLVGSQFRSASSPSPSSSSAAGGGAKGGGGGNRKKNKKKKKVKITTPPPSSLDAIPAPAGIDLNYVGKYRGMVIAAATFAASCCTEGETDDASGARRRSSILDLYSPDPASPNDDERIAVATARAALKYCRANASEGSELAKFVKKENEDECLRVMLVWSCNAFEGGALYERASRANHSCDPNAVVTEVEEEESADGAAVGAAASSDEERPAPRGKRQRIVAATSIEAGDEITISYLGILAYASTPVRRNRLRLTKHFTCRCARCCHDGAVDKAGAVPCPSCHPRVGNGRYLDEDVQYDDEKSVRYAYPTSNEGNAGKGQGGGVRCEECGEVTTSASLTTLIDKVEGKVADRLLSSAPTTSGGEEEGRTDAEHEVDERLCQLSSSVLGARHWTTNLMTLSLLQRQLAALHSAALLGESAPDLTELAECIDSLERMWTFVEGLGLRSHPGHLLSGPTIGVSRALVSLGDVKSKKYAAEWTARVEDYVRRFEGEGMGKVVDALLVAWKREDTSHGGDDDVTMDEDSSDDVAGSNKRARTS